jgi:hypothetical protein
MPGDGPIPKRSDLRRRKNKPVGPVLAKVLIAAPPVDPLEPDEAWHPIVIDWFRSLGESGQSKFYEPSDWQTARYVAEAMSRNLEAGTRFSAELFRAVMAAMTELLTTEGARRRVRIELERGAEQVEPPAIAIMAEYKRDAKSR